MMIGVESEVASDGEEFVLNVDDLLLHVGVVIAQHTEVGIKFVNGAICLDAQVMFWDACAAE